MQHFIDEVLRLFPPAVPVSVKQLTKDDVLPNGIAMKKDESVIVMPPVVHRLKEYWGEDAEEFNPSRWEKASSFHSFQFIPFQKGPRICLGMNMAYEETKAVLSILLRQQYKFTNVNEIESMSLPPTAIFQSLEGILLKIKKI